MSTLRAKSRCVPRGKKEGIMSPSNRYCLVIAGTGQKRSYFMDSLSFWFRKNRNRVKLVFSVLLFNLTCSTCALYRCWTGVVLNCVKDGIFTLVNESIDSLLAIAADPLPGIPYHVCIWFSSLDTMSFAKSRTATKFQCMNINLNSRCAFLIVKQKQCYHCSKQWLFISHKRDRADSVSDFTLRNDHVIC